MTSSPKALRARAEAIVRHIILISAIGERGASSVAHMIDTRPRGLAERVCTEGLDWCDLPAAQDEQELHRWLRREFEGFGNMPHDLADVLYALVRPRLRRAA